MRQQLLQFQITITLLLAPILACSAFTVSTGRTATTATSTGTATSTATRNNRQLQQSTGPRLLLQVPASSSSSSPSSLNYKLFNYQQLSSSSSSSSSSSTWLAAISGESDSDSDSGDSSFSDEETTLSKDVAPAWKRVVLFYKYNKDGSIKSKSDDDDGLTFKQKLAKMGLSALLSYGFVSNMSYCITVSLAWFGFSKKTGLSPLAPGQWKGFLAVYAGFYVFNNFIRPIRLALSVGVTPYFDRAVAAVQRKTKLNKSASIGIVVFLSNICGTISFMSLCIYIASLAAGVPIFPSKV